jgi:glycosyltransferase involved in cell wall biosynthesis
MKNVLFIDISCPEPYTAETLKTKGMGGTEASVVRVAEGLKEYCNVLVAQHNRTKAEGMYIPLSTSQGPQLPRPDAIVLLRSGQSLLALRKEFPNSKLFLWLHDLPNESLVTDWQGIQEARTTTVCVSQFHKTAVMTRVLPFTDDLKPHNIKVIYNPIDDALIPDATPVDPNKLLFFSSPHKGIAAAFNHFDYAKRQNKDFKLYVANPGYYNPKLVIPDGVEVLGVLPHHEAMKHVREAFCVFYPNAGFPETFGLVFAEANAVGTPVLTYNIGAAREVLDFPGQLIAPHDYQTYIDRLMIWRDNRRPTVRCKPQFRLKEVISEWLKLFH